MISLLTYLISSPTAPAKPLPALSPPCEQIVLRLFEALDAAGLDASFFGPLYLDMAWSRWLIDSDGWTFEDALRFEIECDTNNLRMLVCETSAETSTSAMMRLEAVLASLPR